MEYSNRCTWIKIHQSLCEKCPDTEVFLVSIFLYSVRIKYGPEKTPNLETFHTVNKFYHTIKRKIHSLLFLLFDLSGTLASVLLEAKLIVQELWRQNIDCNEEIPKDLGIRIDKWKTQPCLLDNITIPRFHWFTNFWEIEIHIFADASTLAYGAVSYYRIISYYVIMVSFIIGKSKLVPLILPTPGTLESCSKIKIKGTLMQIWKSVNISVFT